MSDIMADIKEEALYNILGKAMNDYIAKNKMESFRILRVLGNMSLQVINNFERDN